MTPMLYPENVTSIFFAEKNTRYEASDQTQLYNKASDKWVSKGDTWDYDTNSCSIVFCGDYQQLMWAESYLVGCAALIYNYDDSKEKSVFTCAFYPSYLEDTTLYSEATETASSDGACEKCEDQWNCCQNKLCTMDPHGLPSNITLFDIPEELLKLDPTNHNCDSGC